MPIALILVGDLPNKIDVEVHAELHKYGFTNAGDADHSGIIEQY